MTIEIITEATDLAALHTHAANRGQVLQVRLRQLCREVATTTTVAEPPTQPRPTAQPELALGYEPTPPPAGAHGILARAAKLNQNLNPKS